jgi:23S rRNA (uracil1939-C5)-methyltransferase
MSLDRGRFAFAEGLTLLEASADRVQPRCPHFGPHKCAGCQWQHIDYSAQLALKTDILLDQLSRLASIESAPFELCIPSPQAWAYRQEATFYPTPDGLGFYSTHAQTLLPIDDCHVITLPLLALYGELAIDLPTLTHVTLRENGAGDVMVILGTSDDQPPELELTLNASVNFLLSDHEPANLIGATHLRYNVLGRSYRVTAGSAWRPQVAQLERLGAFLKEWIAPTGREWVLDLYTGVGLWSGLLAAQVDLITCVDSYPPAMTDAEDNLTDFDNINLIEGAVADVLADLESPDQYEVVILDPSPQGLEVDTLDQLGQVAASRLFYISSDPAPFARDVKRLRDSHGYQLARVQPFDFEPQTARIVTLAELRR